MIWHTFDVMHCEKNLAINVMKIVFGEKDNNKVHWNLENLGIGNAFWLKPHPTQIGETIMPLAPWVMPKDD
jgi:hypothetical protein